MKYIKKSEEYPGALVETNSQVQGSALDVLKNNLNALFRHIWHFFLKRGSFV